MPTHRIGNLDTDKIAKIMTVALEEFANNTYHQASYNRVIRQCGISKGTMYYYFTSKEDLFRTLLQATTKEFASLAGGGPPPVDPAGFWQQTQDLMREVFTRLIDKPILGRFIQNFLTSESRRTPNPATPLVARIDEWLQDHLLTGQLVGAVRRDLPLELLTSLTWAHWETFCGWLRDGELSSPPAESAALLADLLQRSLTSTAAPDQEMATTPA
jgi:AcrR family transcriptional regulator